MEKAEKLSILLTAPGITVEETVDVNDERALKELKGTVSRIFKKYVYLAEQQQQSQAATREE